MDDWISCFRRVKSEKLEGEPTFTASRAGTTTSSALRAELKGSNAKKVPKPEITAQTRATMTLASTTLSMRTWNALFKIELLEVTRSDFAWSRRTTAKCTVAKLRPARASQVMVKRIMAVEVFRGIESTRTDFSECRKVTKVSLEETVKESTVKNSRRMMKQINLRAQ